MEKSPTGAGREVTLPAKVESITAVTAFLEQELEALGCPEKQKMQICVAADEIVTNISMYAYAPGTGDFTVNFAFDGEERAAEITFVDEGVPFGFETQMQLMNNISAAPDPFPLPKSVVQKESSLFAAINGSQTVSTMKPPKSRPSGIVKNCSVFLHA